MFKGFFAESRAKMSDQNQACISICMTGQLSVHCKLLQMGDCVALPDGTIFCCNGAATGIQLLRSFPSQGSIERQSSLVLCCSQSGSNETHTAPPLPFLYASFWLRIRQVDWGHETAQGTLGNLIQCVVQVLQADPLAMAMHQIL